MSVIWFKDIQPFKRRQTYLVPILFQDCRFVDKVESVFVYISSYLLNKKVDVGIAVDWLASGEHNFYLKSVIFKRI